MFSRAVLSFYLRSICDETQLCRRDPPGPRLIRSTSPNTSMRLRREIPLLRYDENIMTSPLISFFTGRGSRRVVETVTPERTLNDVVLPAQTRRTLEQALAQVKNHTLIFRSWGLGERHSSGRGL